VRIAYITPYQGSTLLKRRPIVKNRSMSNRIKIELIAQLLHGSGHDVEVFSHGEVDTSDFRFYPAFEEPEPFHPRIPVHYISSLAIRRVYGLWASLRMLELLNGRHRVSPFDVIIIFNFKHAQLAAARYAVRRRIPLLLEYEDDAFRSVAGDPETGLVTRYHHRAYRRVLASVSGCIAVSPHLLSQVPPGVPTLLLRGVVGDDVLAASERLRASKKDIVLFSGTHTKWNGVEELITAWRAMALPEWQLHITGYGDMTEQLRRMAEASVGIVFHGLVSRQELVDLMASAKVCVSPQLVSQTPGNQFAFKIIEYLAAGAHVVATRMGALEAEVEAGVTYLADNRPETISAMLTEVIRTRRYQTTAERVTQERYGSEAVAKGLSGLLTSVAGTRCTPATYAARGA
jgi:glycosyltransferase involved in cell wall biosynthesis